MRLTKTLATERSRFSSPPFSENRFAPFKKEEAAFSYCAKEKIKVTFTDKAKKLVAEKGYDPSFGARPLKRAIQDLVLDDLALKIVEGKIKEGDKVKVDAAKDQIVIK